MIASTDAMQEALQLVKRQTEIEAAMRQPGGIRVIEERELHAIRRRLQQLPEVTQAVIQAAQALRRSVHPGMPRPERAS